VTVLIKGFIIDCVRQETHSFDSDVTSHPVEKGADVTDHVRPRPITVTLECIVSNTPIEPVASQRPAGGIPAEDAHAWLMGIRDDREPVTIETHRRAYENMVLTSLSEPLDAATGDGLVFSATFVQIELVQIEKVTVISTPRAARKKNLGHKPTRPVEHTELTDITSRGGVSSPDVWPGVSHAPLCDTSIAPTRRITNEDASFSPPGKVLPGGPSSTVQVGTL
jgi:Dit-like tail protein